MFLKRTFFLAIGVLLFIAAYIFYFDFWINGQMENRFRQERRANGVDTGTLTTQIASATTPASAITVAPAAGTTGAVPPSSASDAAAAGATGAMPPGPASDTTPAVTVPDTNAAPVAPNAMPAAPDTNIIIGPLPPSSNPNGAPSPSGATPPDTNSVGPAVPPSSTMLFPGAKNLALFMLAASTPQPVGNIQAPAPVITPTTNSPAATPSTNTPAATAPATTAAASVTTNEVPAGTEPGTARPIPVEPSVIVLLYHQFVPPGVHIPPKLQWTINQDVFETEMKYLHDNGYNVIPMSDLLKFLKHQIGLKPNSVVITIDDGYKSAIVYAAPILKKYGFPWTFFVYPDFITKTESKGAASWPDLLALQADGVDIECHSMTHPDLRSHHQKIKGVWHNFSPAEYDQWLTNETSGAKTLLEQKMGKPITCFAYPYGDYNKEVEARVIAAGFEAIFTVADNPVRSSTPLTSIGRYTITQAVLKDYYAYLRQGALGLAEADPQPGATITNPRPVITAVLSYPGTLDPNSIETSVRDFGPLHHDYDPKTSTLRIYLPRDLIDARVLVNLRVRDAQTNQVLVANWYFNYQSPTAAPVHPPIGATPSATKETLIPATTSATNAAPATNAIPALTSSTAAASLAVPATSQADPPKAASSP